MTAHVSVGKVDGSRWGDCAACGERWPCPQSMIDRATVAPRSGSPAFHALLTEMGALHDRKQTDYGTNSDPFANVRGATDWGIPASLGVCVRMNDKVRRLQAFYRNGSLANESVEDAFMDLAVYALIGLVLYREESEGAQ